MILMFQGFEQLPDEGTSSSDLVTELGKLFTVSNGNLGLGGGFEIVDNDLEDGGQALAMNGSEILQEVVDEEFQAAASWRLIPSMN